MKKMILIGLLALVGCAAPRPQKPFQVRLIDRTTAIEYEGVATTKSGYAGDVTATVDQVEYTGDWVFNQSGGSFDSTFLHLSDGTTGSSSSSSMSAMGNGMAYIRAGDGQFIRCVFNFHTMTRIGLGECRRNDGRIYDMSIHQ